MPAKTEYSQELSDKVVYLYSEKLYNCSYIARELNIKPHQVGTILKRNNVQIEAVGGNRFYRKLSNSTKSKISNTLTGKPGGRLGKKSTDDIKRSYIKAQLKMPELNLSKYHDYDKLKFVKSWLIHHCRGAYIKDKNVQYVQSFLDKFYFDKYFNKIYDTWKNDPCKNSRPTMDHIIPKAKGGDLFSISNLQVLTWFENRAKNDMTYDEWLTFRKKHKINGSLFKKAV